MTLKVNLKDDFMNIIHIFALVEDSLYAVEDFKKSGKSAYEVVVNRWQDTEYLEDYFDKYEKELKSFYPNMTVEKAVRKTLMEVMDFDAKVYEAANKKKLGKFIFRALHKTDKQRTYIDSKAYGPDNKSWLRLYAIRLAEDIYVVTGGGIKLTEAMTTNELKDELKNLKKAKKALLKMGLLEAEKGSTGFLELKTK